MEKFDPQYKKRNFPQVRPEWLALRQEAVLQPNQRIVDAHHHFWDEEAAPYHADDLLADIGTGHGVAATILIEGKARYRPTGPEHLRSVGETEFAVAQAERAAGRGVGVCQGIVAWADQRSAQDDYFRHKRASFRTPKPPVDAPVCYDGLKGKTHKEVG